MQNYSSYIENLDGKVLLGCDGFIDEVYQVVQQRQSVSDFSAMEKLRLFGELIVSRAEGGVGLEIVHKRRCEGGFVINTGRVAGLLGIRPTLLGLFGQDKIDPAFAFFDDICELVSLGDPALTIAFEFNDGKVLMSDLKTVANLTWDDVVERLGEETLKKLFSSVDILGLGYWSLTPDFDNLLSGFINLSETARPPKRMFFDFADIGKKSAESLAESLELIRELNIGIPMTLSANEHEAGELFRVFDVRDPGENPAAVNSALLRVREAIEIDEVIVHTPTFAAASSSTGEEAFVVQDTQTKVVRTAGAGDSFNGGYLCASLGDLSIKERLVIANATTAFFVTHARPPNKEELIAQIEMASDK
ncbi:MAG: PfkB family carbohydrate kinase [Verrucomicrobiota bacterium]